MSKLARIVCLFLAAAACGVAQTANDPIFPSLAGQMQQNQPATSSQSGTGQTFPLPSTRIDPTTITNVSPGQDIAERQRELQQEQMLRRLMSTSTPTPEPDIEFQEFVASTLGMRLPIFGHNLFDSVPSTFAPLDRVQVTPDYILGPGDELVIRTWGQINVDWRAVVDRTGAIYIPKVGVFNVAGVRYEDLHDHLNAQIGRIFKAYQLSVTLGSLRSIQVFVVGQVKRPGVYTISSLSSLVDALFACGGPSKRGSIRRIQLKRNGKAVTTFDLYDLIVNGDKSKDAKLLPGDVIFVPAVGPLVALSGSVNTPAIFEMKERSALGEVIGYAGGLTNTAAGDRVVVERIDDHRVRHAEEFLLTPQGLARELHDGDVVRFLRMSSKFDNAVTLRGNVAVPGKYPWRAGMRVRDLIPSRDALITEEYWKRQNRLAVNPGGQSFAPLVEAPARDQVGVQGQSQTGQSAPSRAGAPPGDRSQAFPDDTLSQGAGRTEIQRIRPEELKNEVKRSAAEINWEYAVVQRLDRDNLTTHLLPFNLGKAIAGEEVQNLPLEAGDVVTIFTQTDLQVPIAQQSKFVRLEGEFRTAGVYRAEAGETLRHLVNRAGGFTPQAYLYGAEFTRESTREEQQKRLEEYINELEKSIERNAGALQGHSGDEALAAREALDGQRRLLGKLRLLKSTGRIVLELKPDAGSLDQFPDLVLEDGDRLLVPFKPATVGVIGSVYASNAFIFKPGKTVGDYMRISGGATTNGDRGRAFVIRADGSLVSSQAHRGLIAYSFNNLRVMPGDTIVVPEKLNRGATLRGFKDWTQIIGQFVIGAAAAKVLFP